MLSWCCTACVICIIIKNDILCPLLWCLCVVVVHFETHSHSVPETTCDFYPNNPNNPSKMAIIRPKTADSRG